jgi:hypothetical protein
VASRTIAGVASKRRSMTDAPEKTDCFSLKQTPSDKVRFLDVLTPAPAAAWEKIFLGTDSGFCSLIYRSTRGRRAVGSASCLTSDPRSSECRERGTHGATPPRLQPSSHRINAI